MVKGRPLSRDGNYWRFGAVLLCICFSFYHSDCSFENGFQEKVEAGEHLGNCCKDLGENLPVMEVVRSTDAGFICETEQMEFQTDWMLL